MSVEENKNKAGYPKYQESLSLVISRKTPCDCTVASILIDEN